MNTTAIPKKRKIIDLTEDTLRRLSILAATQGHSLKSYIEHLLTVKANSVEISVTENPSPSNDSWFTDSDNISSLKDTIFQSQSTDSKRFTLDEIKSALGL